MQNHRWCRILYLTQLLLGEDASVFALRSLCTAKHSLVCVYCVMQLSQTHTFAAKRKYSHSHTHKHCLIVYLDVTDPECYSQ